METTISTNPLKAATKNDALQTTIAINASNPTIVACWDLDSPSTKEKRKVLHPARVKFFESLNPKGDHRAKVPKVDIELNGKYGAICKLFMGYIGLPKDEYIGTGWLISPTLIVTAGHNGIENGHALEYIKVYFGYSGPESIDKARSISRYGTRVAMPSEFLKAEAATHDVSFIVLNKAVSKVKPIKYVSTPTAKTEAQLGVVGYPGDLDSGNSMYQEWIPAVIDLAHTNQLLSYEIDTDGGQSGSPVLMNDASTAVGVHVAGGFPNIGSVVGPAGNQFGEYILALAVISGDKSVHAVKVDIKSGYNLSAPGFSLVQVEPEALKASAESTTDLTGYASASDESDEDNSEDRDTDEDDEDENSEDGHGDKESAPVSGGRKSLLEKQIDNPWGRHRAKHRKQFNKLSVMHFPESLALKESDDQVAAPTVAQIVDATQKAVEHPDVQTIFFVGLTPSDLDAQGKKNLGKLVGMVQSWQAWSSSVCEGNVQQQIDKNILPAAPEGQFARSTYRAKVFDYLFKQATWFAKMFDQNMTKHIEVQKVDFHTAILKTILEGFAVPETAYVRLEKILTTIGDNITASKTKTQEKQQYWLMLTRYVWQPEIQTAQPVIRVINFSIDQKMSDYTAMKSQYTSISIDMVFGQCQADFVANIYKKIQKAIDDKLVKAGMDLVTQKSIMVPI